jgi:hypothetical protein
VSYLETTVLIFAITVLMKFCGFLQPMHISIPVQQYLSCSADSKRQKTLHKGTVMFNGKKEILINQSE